MHQTLFPEILNEYGDRVAFVYKDFPLVEIHPWAMHAAVDANCLAAQNAEAYWDFADYIHANQKDVNAEKDHLKQFGILDNLTLLQGQKHNVDTTKLQSCVKAQNEDPVKASVKEGEGLGIQATPTLFVNGEEMDGALPLSEVRSILDRALQQAGVAPPAHPPETPQPAQAKPSGM
jgi:protein-disulfide isomerase